MTEREFTSLLDRYGSDARRWPPAHWDAASALLARSPAARGAWQEAKELDAALALAVPPGDSLPVELIVARATAAAQERPPASRFPAARRFALPAWLGFGVRLGWAPVGGLAACLCAGVVLGSALPRPAPQPTTADVLALAMGASRAAPLPLEEP